MKGIFGPSEVVDVEFPAMEHMIAGVPPAAKHREQGKEYCRQSKKPCALIRSSKYSPRGLVQPVENIPTLIRESKMAHPDRPKDIAEIRRGKIFHPPSTLLRYDSHPGSAEAKYSVADGNVVTRQNIPMQELKGKIFPPGYRPTKYCNPMQNIPIAGFEPRTFSTSKHRDHVRLT